MKVTYRISGLLVIALVMLGAWTTLAQDASVVIERSSEDVMIPEELPGGIVTLTLNNTAETPFEPILARLNADVTVDAFNEALMQGPEAALGLVSLLGGTSVAPGTSTDVTYDLKPGAHVLIDFAGEMPTVKTFTVTEGSAASTAPEADVTVSLLDFAFSLPVELSAGEQTWTLANNGGQWHEMAIFPIDESMTVAEYRDFINSALSGQGEMPQPAAIWLPMNQGERAWWTVDLEPGMYAAICFLPDFASGHAHAELGMSQIITVSE